MKPRLAYGILAVLLCMSLAVPLVRGASWNSIEEWDTGTLETDSVSNLRNLDVTAGAGDWLTGGFDFDGSATYATNTSFQPFHNIDAFSIIIWVTPNDISAGVELLVSQRSTSSNIMGLQRTGDDVEFYSNNGGTSFMINAPNVLTVGDLFVIGAVWDKGGDGKGHVYINGTEYISGDIQNGNTWCPTDLDVGRRTDANYYWNGSMYGMSFYDFALTDSQVNASSIVPDTQLSGVIHYYTMDEGAGAIFYDFEGDVWHTSESWEGDLVSFPISWQPVTDWEGDLETFNMTHWFLTETLLAAWSNLIEGGLSILGFPMMFMGIGIIGIGIKNKTDYEEFFMKWLLIGFAFIGLGFAMAFSPVIAVAVAL